MVNSSRRLLVCASILLCLQVTNAIYTPSALLNETALDEADGPGFLAARELLSPTALASIFFGGPSDVQAFSESQLDTRSMLNETEPNLQRREVYNPKITHPKSSTVWVAGSMETVTWDTSDAPMNITNPMGKVVLGYVEDGTDEHLDLDNPLADEFPIMQGSVDIKVPDIGPGHEYIIVLFGDSGNKSPAFTIN